VMSTNEMNDNNVTCSDELCMMWLCCECKRWFWNVLLRIWWFKVFREPW
jgi:hypothetical protein